MLSPQLVSWLLIIWGIILLFNLAMLILRVTHLVPFSVDTP